MRETERDRDGADIYESKYYLGCMKIDKEVFAFPLQGKWGFFKFN